MLGRELLLRLAQLFIRAGLVLRLLLRLFRLFSSLVRSRFRLLLGLIRLFGCGLRRFLFCIFAHSIYASGSFSWSPPAGGSAASPGFWNILPRFSAK